MGGLGDEATTLDPSLYCVNPVICYLYVVCSADVLVHVPRYNRMVPSIWPWDIPIPGRGSRVYYIPYLPPSNSLSPLRICSLSTIKKKNSPARLRRARDQDAARQNGLSGPMKTHGTVAGRLANEQAGP